MSISGAEAPGPPAQTHGEVLSQVSQMFAESAATIRGNRARCVKLHVDTPASASLSFLARRAAISRSSPARPRIAGTLPRQGHATPSLDGSGFDHAVTLKRTTTRPPVIFV